MFTKHTFLYNV